MNDDGRCTQCKLHLTSQGICPAGCNDVGLKTDYPERLDEQSGTKCRHCGMPLQGINNTCPSGCPS